MIMQNANTTRCARVDELLEQLFRKAFAERKTYCNLEVFRGVGKRGAFGPP